MSGYRPITDVWLMARPKFKEPGMSYYGAYPSGFLERARALLGVRIDEPVLHVCGGRVRDYKFYGFGPNDKTLDLDPALEPDFLQDAREPLPPRSGPFSGPWGAILIDRPYTEADADHYAPGRDVLPAASQLIRNALDVLEVGRRVGILDYEFPRPPSKGVKLVAACGVLMGYGNRIRCYTVFEKR